MNCKVSTLKRLVLLILASVLVTACASSSHLIVQPTTKKFSEFDELLIKVVEDKIGTETSALLAATAPAELQKKIAQMANRNPDVPFFSEVNLGPATTDNPLVLACTLAGFDEGNRALRWIIGFGAGKANSYLLCSFNDVKGEKIAEVNFRGEQSTGLFGGGAESTVDAILDGIIRYLLLNY